MMTLEQNLGWLEKKIPTTRKVWDLWWDCFTFNLIIIIIIITSGLLLSSRHFYLILVYLVSNIFGCFLAVYNRKNRKYERWYKILKDIEVVKEEIIEDKMIRRINEQIEIYYSDHYLYEIINVKVLK